MTDPVKDEFGQDHSDETTAARAVRDGDDLVGPTVLVRCHFHPYQLERWRWRWSADETIESAEAEIVSSCKTCADKQDADA